VEAPARFEVNRVYERNAILDEYGGQRYQGIVTPAVHPLVFIITGEAGLEHGYKDELDDDGVFHYYGEGQDRDMEFSGGNAAILNHAENEEELHLFEKPRKNFWRYRGEMVCTGFRWKTREDGTRAIVFQLINADDDRSDGDLDLRETLSLEELAALADGDPTEESDPTVGLRKTYARSAALREFVRGRANGYCEGCGNPAPFESSSGPYLEAHHTLRRSDSGPGNRSTVIALCPNCHARVHRGLAGGDYNEELKAKLIQIVKAVGI
jgi:5-methylcytosine-specific restriction enzyme A